MRTGVYSMHGHYLECHLIMGTIERLSVGAMARLRCPPADTFDSVSDYEAVTAPLYAWRHALARDTVTGSALNGVGTVKAWRALGGGARRDGSGGTDSSRRAALVARLRGEAIARGFPLAVAALNRAGLGPL